MKTDLKRGIIILLSVCMVLGIFAGSGLNLARAADAEPTVETVVSAPNLIANGAFGEVRDVNVYPNLTVPTGWTNTNFSAAGDAITLQVTDAYAHDGDYSMHITGAPAKTINICNNYANDA
ncbi:MAG: hypothetical protein E7455_07465, partial [Ruminococcaceae bacterium]|nr:hypothetical protein [Oscillospiraceae bacterium]